MPYFTRANGLRSNDECPRNVIPMGGTISKAFLTALIVLFAAASTSSLSPPTDYTNPKAQPSYAYTNTTSFSTTGNRFLNESLIPSSYGNFDRVVEPFVLDSASIRVVKWRSRQTGLSVVWAETESPLVNADFTVANEIFNDSGIPHTLDHLILRGSEKYPYSGILDKLATRSFGSGTTPGTTTIYTVYNLETAGPDGFLRLLPVYFDSIFNPTLTPEAFVTEIYHVNDQGEEGGVLFNELQSVENTSAQLMALCTQRALYPTTSAYRSDPLGLMQDIRVLTLDQIKKYQNTYYRPYNLQLTITGKLDPTALLSTLQHEVESSIIQHRQDHIPNHWKRPLLETQSKNSAVLQESKTLTVEFPSKDEAFGEVQISWVGPTANDTSFGCALDILQTYFSEPKISPLSKRFIEIDSPLFTSISFLPSDGGQYVLHAVLSSVPAEHLSTVGDSLRKALSEEADLIDMDYMNGLIQREILKTKQAFEVDPHGTLQPQIIFNFLYGKDNDLVAILNQLKFYEALATWTAQTWSTFMKKWLVEAPSLTVIGRPSAGLSEKLEADSKQRITENRNKHGTEGLKKLGDQLDKAQKLNNRPIPNRIMSQFPIPTSDSIQWNDVEVAQANNGHTSALQAFIDQKDPVSLPYFVQFNHIESRFLSIDIVLSPSNVPSELFPLLWVYIKSFFSLPIKRKDGSSLSYHEVVSELDKQTVEYAITPDSPIHDSIQIHMTVESSKYAAAIALLRDLLWGSTFDTERLRSTIMNDLQDIPSMKRDSSQVLQALYDEMVISSDESPLSSLNFLRLEETQPMVLNKLKSQPGVILKQMERLRSHLLRAPSIRISVSGNIRALEEPKTTWVKNFEQLKPSPLHKPLMVNATLGSEGIKPSGKATVTVMASSELNCAFHFAQGPQGFDHPDKAALAVAIRALNMHEGYLWKAIRATGLAYFAYVSSDLEIGHVRLEINSSPDNIKAFHESAKVINDIANRKLKLNDEILETAKSSVVYSTVASISTGQAAAFDAFSNVAFKGVSPEFSKSQVQTIMTVSVEDVIRVIRKYILALFDSKQSSAALACSATKADETVQSLHSMGYAVEKRAMTDKQ
ncbi:hypothetical protein O181_015020 [Austropuccinia psidii MF-1]|uniref:Peptidase M16 C-terminal domain-containing protein n=1 Tax=Austropuccinia psidii MF-1 TaxID=1389203 RepID=A0A9Q3C320_9BASI|nr:hypothetical protein [Austropuccinia psidii MF-1]